MNMKPIRVLLLGVSAIVASPHAWAEKPVVGIGGIKTAAQNISCTGWDAYSGHNCNQYLSSGFVAMLETAIVKSGKMDVMERSQLGGVIEEQGLGEIGLTTSGGRIGGLTGVDYLIHGSITKFGARESGFAISGRAGLIGGLVSGTVGRILSPGLSRARVTTEMAVDLKVTDVASGRIVLADTVEGEARQGESFSVAGVSRSETGADPFADVQRIVAAKLAEAVITVKIPFKVIKVQADGTLILNYGNAFLKPGDVLALFDVGEQFVDPDTGEVLGSEETEIGTVQVTASEAKFSKARSLGAGEAIAVGSILRRSKIAAAQQASPERKRSGGRF